MQIRLVVKIVGLNLLTATLVFVALQMFSDSTGTVNCPIPVPQSGVPLPVAQDTRAKKPPKPKKLKTTVQKTTTPETTPVPTTTEPQTPPPTTRPLVMGQGQHGATWDLTQMGTGAAMPPNAELLAFHPLPLETCLESDFYKFDPEGQKEENRRCGVGVVEVRERVCMCRQDSIPTAGGNSDYVFCYRTNSYSFQDKFSRRECEVNNPHELDGPAFFAGAPAGEETQHVFQDTLPMLGLMLPHVDKEEAKTFNVVMFLDNKNGWGRFVLERAGLAPEQVVELTHQRHVCAPRAIMVFFTPIYVYGAVPAEGNLPMHRLVVPHDTPPTDRDVVIYLSRKEAGNGRCVHNEADVEDAVRQWTPEGATYVQFDGPGGKSKEELIALFQRVRFVVGVHGGAFLNLFWMPADRFTTILEMRVGGKQARNWHNTARGLQQTYDYLMMPCDNAPDPYNCNPDSCTNVDVGMLVSKLAEMNPWNRPMETEAEVTTAAETTEPPHATDIDDAAQDTHDKPQDTQDTQDKGEDTQDKEGDGGESEDGSDNDTTANEEERGERVSGGTRTVWVQVAGKSSPTKLQFSGDDVDDLREAAKSKFGALLNREASQLTVSWRADGKEPLDVGGAVPDGSSSKRPLYVVGSEGNGFVYLGVGILIAVVMLGIVIRCFGDERATGDPSASLSA